MPSGAVKTNRAVPCKTSELVGWSLKLFVCTLDNMSLGIFTAVVVSPISEKMSLTSLLWSEARDTRNLSIARLWFLALFLLFVFVVGLSGQSEIGQSLHFAREGIITRLSSDYHLLGYSPSP